MTNKGKKHSGKRRIVKDVMSKGLSARKAGKAVDAVFDLMKQALSYHEPVEIPGIGELRVVTQKGCSRWRLQKTRNIADKQIETHIVKAPGRRRLVKLKPDPELKLPVDSVPVGLPAEASAAPNPTIRRIPTIAHTYRGGFRPGDLRWRRL